MSKGKKKYYVVWQGKYPGVYDNWNDCEAQVHGVENAKFKAFPSREEAEKAFAEDYTNYIEFHPATKVTREPKNREGVIMPSIAVDAACSGNPGDMEFRGVLVDTESLLFHRGPLKEGTNNIGEFLAIVLGLAWLKQNNLSWPLYSDSRTAISWVKQKQCKSKLPMTANNAPIFDMIRSAENWLLTNTYTTQIIKWNTDKWGEIPADFGRK